MPALPGGFNGCRCVVRSEEPAVRVICRVEAGEQFVITRRGKVVARLAPPETADSQQQRALDAVAALRARRKGVSLGRLRGRDLIDEGRR